MEDILALKSVPKFICEICDYKCSRSCDWNRHISTRKHKGKTISRQFSVEKASTTPNKINCKCGKEFNCRQGLWKHRKNCNLYYDYANKTKLSSEEIFMTLIKDNQEFKQMLIEQNNKIMELASSKNTTVITNNTTNNHNFNLQMFLNVQCKDALNITEFVESLQPKIEDLENTGRLGYVEGISKIFIN